MYYIPDYFRPEEFFSEKVIRFHTMSGTGFDRKIQRKIWRLVDNRVTWTLDRIREHYNRGVIMNTWLWGGETQHRGFRYIPELIDRVKFIKSGIVKLKFSSVTSQHCLGRASDSIIKGISAEEVREDIRKNPKARRYRFISAVENRVSWLHIDVRGWNKNKHGILFFNP